MFDFCDNLLDDIPGAFMALAGRKGWTIERPGGVAVRFRNIGTFDSDDAGGPLDVTLDLIGNCEYSGGTEFCQPFPPEEPGTTSTIPLISYRIHARGQPGLNSECHGERALLDPQESTLLITAPP